ncbi:transposase [Streptomyces sp. NPDC054933]
MRNLPGRKTDVADSVWIARLVEHGLVRPGFVPPEPIRHLRDLTRRRAELTAERGPMRRKIAELREALTGNWSAHHAFLARIMLDRIDACAVQIEAVTAQIEAELSEHRGAEGCPGPVERLATIPGVSTLLAQVIIAEVGLDMARFPTPGHLASWAGMCPGNNESAGRRGPGRTRHGDVHLRAALDRPRSPPHVPRTRTSVSATGGWSVTRGASARWSHSDTRS